MALLFFGKNVYYYIICYFYKGDKLKEEIKMSISNIVDYINKTPGNTNPSVVKSMVEGEMNSTLKEANAYTDSQRLGYSEPAIVQTALTYEQENVFSSSNGLGWYYSSVTCIDKGIEEGKTYALKIDGVEYVGKCIKKDGALYLGNGAYGTYGRSNYPVNGPDTGEEFCICASADIPVRLNISLKNKGTYTCCLYL